MARLKKQTSKAVNMKVMCRVAYPSLDKATQYKGQGRFTYNACIILEDPKEKEKYQRAIKYMIDQHFEGDPEGVDVPHKGGKEKNHEAFKNTIYFSAKAGTDYKPQVVSLIGGYHPLDNSALVSGDYCIVSLQLYKSRQYDRICVGLNNVALYKRTDEVISGRPTAEEDFKDEALKEYATIIEAAKAANTEEGQGFTVQDEDDVPFFDSSETKAG